jgi:uroporphyrinogen-III synthase
LRGLSVLVTRPRDQAESLCEAIETAHGRPVRYPTLEISGPRDLDGARRNLAGAASADILIFVSANAVRHAYPLLPEALPARLRIAAVGEATAARLREVGLEPDLVPRDRQDSEGLLAMAELQALAGSRILIVRGEGGRELLADQLSARGAEVSYAEVYRRGIPHRDSRALIDGWEDLVDAVTVTSVQALENLVAMLGEDAMGLLEGTPIVAASERIAARAAELGCDEVTVSEGASDDAIMAALCALAADAD